jgi:hypothetical protein
MLPTHGFGSFFLDFTYGNHAVIQQPIMRQLSSSSTWWHKKAFPMIWFGFLGFMMLIMLPSVLQEQTPAPIILIPLGLAIFGFFLLRLLVWPLVDEVYLDSDDVVVRNKGEEDRFPFSNVINVQGSEYTNPERITLNLKQPCLFGDEIKFMPPPRWLAYGKHPLANELIRRIRERE